MAAPLDDGVQKLEEFCALLTTTNAKLQEQTSAMESHGHEVDQLEDAAGSKLEAFSGELHELEQGLQAAREDATGEIQQLTQQAREAADSRLPSVDEALDRAGAEFGRKVDTDEQELREGFSALTDDGFEALSRGIDSAQAQLGSTGDHLEEVLDGLGQAVDGFEHQVEQTQTEATAHLDQVGQELQQEVRDELVAASDQCESDFAEVAARAHSPCDEAHTALQSLYGDCGSEGESAGDEVIQSFATLAGEAETFATEQASAQQTAVDAVEGGAMSGLGDELDQVESGLTAGEGITQVLEPMVEKLEIVGRVIEQIDRALDALE